MTKATIAKVKRHTTEWKIFLAYTLIKDQYPKHVKIPTNHNEEENRPIQKAVKGFYLASHKKENINVQ